MLCRAALGWYTSHLATLISELLIECLGGAALKGTRGKGLGLHRAVLSLTFLPFMLATYVLCSGLPPRWPVSPDEMGFRQFSDSLIY